MLFKHVSQDPALHAALRAIQVQQDIQVQVQPDVQVQRAADDPKATGDRISKLALNLAVGGQVINNTHLADVNKVADNTVVKPVVEDTPKSVVKLMKVSQNHNEDNRPKL